MIIDIIRTTKIIEVRIGPRGRPGADGASAWADITGKPSTFPPSTHTHPQSEVTGLEAALAGKAASVHTHAIADTTGLQTALDGKAAATHTHNQSDVTGLTSALGAKADLVDGMVPTAQIPAIAITEFLGTVANQSAMLALTGQRGDWCNRSDVSKAFVLVAEPASTLSNWAAIDYPAAPVLSVNGQTGTVVLGKADVGLVNVANALQLIAANNLSDLTNAATARVNLGLGNVANADTTNASNITSGTLSTDRLNASSGGLGFDDAGKVVKFSAFGHIETTVGIYARTFGGGTANPQAFYGFDQLAYYQAAGQVTVLPATLTGTRTITLPDRTGTLITDADTGTVTNAMLAGSIALSKLSITGTPDGTKFLRDDGSWQAINLSGYATTGANTFNGAQTITPAANSAAVTVSGYSLTGSNAQSLLSLTGTWNTSGTPSAIFCNITDTASNASSLLLQLQTGGTNRAVITKTGLTTLGSSAIAGAGTVLNLTSVYGTSSISVGGGGSFVTSGAISSGGTIFVPLVVIGGDVGLYRDEAQVLALRGGTNAQASRTYNTFTSSTNFERFTVDWRTTANTCRVGTEKGSGGGTARAMSLITDGTNRLTIDALGRIIPVLPTSSAGLPTGSLWNDAGTVKVA